MTVDEQIQEALDKEGQAKSPMEASFWWGKRVGLIAAKKTKEEA